MAEVCAGVRTHSLVGWLVGEFPSQFRFARSNKPTCLCVCGEFWLNFLNPKFVKYTHVLYVCKNSPYKNTRTWFPSLFSWVFFHQLLEHFNQPINQPTNKLTVHCYLYTYLPTSCSCSCSWNGSVLVVCNCIVIINTLYYVLLEFEFCWHMEFVDDRWM